MQGRHQKISYKTEKTVWLPESQWIVVEHTHEPIIDKDTFETVQQMLKERTRSGKRGKVHPLSKKIVCACCGSFMEQTGQRTRADGTKTCYVRCRMHQRAPEVCGNRTCTNLTELQNVVLGRIRAYAADWFDPEPMELPRQADAARQRAQALQEERRTLQAAVDRRRKALQELYLDKASGLIDAAQFSALNKSFLEEVSSAEARLKKLEAELEQQKGGCDDLPARKQRVRELAQVPHLTRELAVLLVNRVMVGPKDARTGEQRITIEWNF